MVSRQFNKSNHFFSSYRAGPKFWFGMFFLLMMVFCINQMRNPALFPIRHVKIIGAQHIDHQELQKLLLPAMKKSFFVLQPVKIRDRLLQLSWISDASVVRSWPDEVVINIAEYQPIALWNENKLLSVGGEVFSPNKKSFPLGLPHFVAPEGSQLTVIENYHRINKLIAPLGTDIFSVELTPWKSWIMVLKNGIRIHVGYKDVLTRINHFVKVYAGVVGERAQSVDYIDLQYPDGIAVRWKTVS